MSTYNRYGTKVDDTILNRALWGSMIIHGLFLFMEFHSPLPLKEPRKEAIKVEFVTLEAPKKVVPVAPAKIERPVEKKVIAKVPQKKIDAGTLKKVENSKVLGNVAAKTVKPVQKGNPISKDFTAYKPNTDFRKLRADNIGTGGTAGITKTISASGGSGDTYKAPNFAVKKLGATSLGDRFTIKKLDDGGSGTGSGGGIGDATGSGFGDGTITGSRNGTLETAKILTNVGSLTGSTVGTIDSSKGAEGLGRKGTIAIANVPEESIVLGNMDPDVIRKILLQHLAQFRYCYQSELERSQDKQSGLMNLNFEIGSSGGVDRVNVNAASSINSNVKGCVAGVLRGITFPEPRGGGTVAVKQPINFYPKYN